MDKMEKSEGGMDDIWENPESPVELHKIFVNKFRVSGT
jgi:hypothetical protein